MGDPDPSSSLYESFVKFSKITYVAKVRQKDLGDVVHGAKQSVHGRFVQVQEIDAVIQNAELKFRRQRPLHPDGRVLFDVLHPIVRKE